MSKAADKIRQVLQAPLGPNVPSGASRQFVNLVKAIGEAGSNHEEVRVIRKEAKLLEQKTKEPNINPRVMKEYLLAQCKSVLEKRVGYLAVSLFLDEDHEMMLLLVNTLQQDLKSTNVVEVCIALTTIGKVMNQSMIPAVMPDVEKLLNHKREIVRKKAVLALHRFYSRDPKSISHLSDNLRKALCDSDPGVMVASLNVFYAMRSTALGLLKDLVGSFVDILKQVIDRRLTRDFDYHKVPAPWMQIKLLRLLAITGADDQRASSTMYEVLQNCLAKAESQGSAAYAVVYECLCTITKIYPAPQLVGMAADSIGRFLKAENNNLKYLGITALVAVVQVNPAYAAEHQMVVIECLDDPDETLKRKTLELLCKMTNPANVTVITQKLVDVDPFLRKDLVPRVVQLAERFAPDNKWYVETMITLLEHAGDLVTTETMNSMLMLISNPDSGDDAADTELRLFAFEAFMELLESKPAIPEKLTHAMCWVLGEYAYLGKDDYDQEVVMELVVGLLGRKYENDFETKGWVLTALMKLVAHNGIYPEAVRVEVDKMKSSGSINLQQRAYEIERLIQAPQVMQAVLPIDASSDDLGVDATLGFLNGFVQASIQAGAKPYLSTDRRAPKPAVTQAETDVAPSMRFEAYEKPTDVHSSIFAGLGAKPAAAAHAGAPSAANGGSGGAMGDLVDLGLGLPTVQETPRTAPEPTGLKVAAGKRRWGKGGDKSRVKEDETATGGPGAADGGSVGGAAVPSVGGAASAATNIQVEAVAAAEEAKPVTPEVSRKQAMANAFFATTTTSSARTSSFTSRARKKRPAGSAAPNILTPAAPAAAGSGGADLAAAPVGDLLGGLGGGGGGGGLSAGSGSAAEPVGDLLSGLGGGVAGAVAAPAVASTGPGELPANLSQLPHVRNDTNVCTNPSVEVTYAKVKKPNALAVVLFVRNSSGGALAGLAIQLDVGAELAGSANSVVVSCAPGEVSVHVVDYTCTTPVAAMSIKGQFNTATLAGAFSISLSPSDFLRALALDTPTFGANWQQLDQFKAEKTGNALNSKFKSVSEFMSGLVDAIGLHPVQIINQEAILAGTVLGNPATICLVHGKLTGNAVDLLVRTTSALFSQAVATESIAASNH
eukprot:gene7265-33171_t